MKPGMKVKEENALLYQLFVETASSTRALLA